MLKREKKLLKKVIEHYGTKSQLGMVQEECAELIQAVSKFNRDGSNANLLNLMEEAEDVQIMLDQLWLMYPRMQSFRREKMERMKERINKDG